MNIKLSDHFSLPRLVKFTLPSIAMMIFTSFYTIIDGLFVANEVGSEAFAALNLVYPMIQVLGAFGFMMGAGGSALVCACMGEGHPEKARRRFSLIILFLTVAGLLLCAGGLAVMKSFCQWMGAEGRMLEDCMVYGGILMAMEVFFFLQNCFQNFLIAAERPRLGLTVSLISGVENMVLDFLLMYVWDFGIAGAALATGLSWITGALIPLAFFARKNGTPLYFQKPDWDGSAIVQSMSNGASEMVSNLSLSVVNMIYNLELMKLLGSDGVVAYGIIQYVCFVFVSVYLGYAMSTAPIIAYQYGAGNHKELKSLLYKSLLLTGLYAIGLTALAETSANLLAAVFVSHSPELMRLTETAIRIYSISFLLCGFNIFASSFFTALNNGLVSGALSFVRTFLFQTGSIFLMAELFGVNGIWLAVTVAESLSLVMSGGCLFAFRKKYGY